MVDWKKLADSASEFVNKRGGAKSVMEDASELAEIAKRDGSLSDKAKAAGQALKEPGAHHQASPAQPDEQSQASQGVADDQPR
jgi:hypothetical protein